MARITERRAVHGFTEVHLRGYGMLEITQNPGLQGEETLAIEADDILMPRIESEVRGSRLILGVRMPWYEWLSFWLTWIFIADKGIRFVLRANRITEVDIGGSGRARVAGLRAESCRLRIGGSGKLEASGIEASEIEAEIAGSGRVECAGKADAVRVRISGSGRVRAEDLSVRHASLRIGGSGRISVHASESLEAWVGGSGRVDYRGNPAVTTHIAGSGRVRATG